MKANETLKTIIFVAVAGLFVGVAALAYYVSTPEVVEGFEKEGKPFFPAYQNPNDAVSLEVTAFNADKTYIKTFAVNQEEKKRVIPPYNYPADAKDRFANTASSIIGLKRGALVSRIKADHKKYQVEDPKKIGSQKPGETDSPHLYTVGKRITLKGEGNSVLFDLIIGKEDPKRNGLYYTRLPGKNAVWLSQIDIDLSTKFSDWINSDLLGITSADVRSIEIKRYSIDETLGRIAVQENNILSRSSGTTPWGLKGMDTKTEEVESTNVNDILSNLTSLKIVGVHPKPQGLNPDLTISPKFSQDPRVAQLLHREMGERGFFVQEDKTGSLMIYSNEGEVIATTEDGVAYDLYFGELFTGTEYDIEAGFSKVKKKEPKKEKEKDKKEKDDKAEPAKPTPPPEVPLKKGYSKNRYLFVTARFEREALGDVPQKPAKPTKPKPTKPKPPEPKKEEPKKEEPKKEEPKKETTKKNEEDKAKEVKPAKEEKKTEEKKPVSETSAKKKEEKKIKPEKKESQPKAEEKPKVSPEEEAYKKLLDKYDSDLLKFNKAKTEYEQKIKEGLDKAEKLNQRFGKWYYVISAESFENLRLARKDLVKPKEKKTDKPNRPGFPQGGLPPGFKLPGSK